MFSFDNFFSHKIELNQVVSLFKAVNFTALNNETTQLKSRRVKVRDDFARLVSNDIVYHLI